MPRKIKDIEGYVRKLSSDFKQCKLNFSKLEGDFKKQVDRISETTTAILNIISSGDEICIQDVDSRDKWFKIVCDINNNCIPKYTWTTRWKIEPKGFSLISMLDNRWKGWHGQYEKSELRYDELPKEILLMHHNKLVEHIKNIGIWYPCHIYNDFTGDLYRP